MKVAIYLRTSTDDQNPENQLEDCQKINNYGDPEIFEEKQSAWKDEKEREKLEILKRIIRKEGLDHLIIWDFDRLFRNRERFKEFLLFLKSYKVQLHSFRQQWMEEINKVPAPWNEIVYDMLINVFGWMAEEESKKKSDRVKIAFKNKKGKKWGRPSISKNTQEEIIKLFKEGKSIREICSQIEYWDKNRNKKNISRGAVHKIITEFRHENPSYSDSSKKVPLNDKK
ncbi:MAG: recombinase family protein [Clostridia bacterium]|nr:recombinase family protein [Clostridia bacterium]